MLFVMIFILSLASGACNLSSDACYDSKNPDVQIQECSKVIGSPGYKQEVAYNNRCFGYSLKGQLDLALADCAKAIELDPKYDSPHIGLGNIYLKKGQYDIAITEYSKAIEINPTESQSYTGRGVAYEHKGLYDKSLADYNKAIELKPTYSLAWMNRG